ncbi:MAG: transcription-repair coupling factor, partial [Acidimicrobiales bacterium]|nr:transcription-repair coupling factor [Acidimicrobiales bacterium]
MSLRSLPSLLRHEPAMVDAMASRSGALAVPDAAVAFVVAGMCRLGERRPLLVVTPTVVDAERLSHDVGAFLGEDAVALFPAWDTLPFERVSPELSTMGRRLRLLWRVQDTGRAPAVIVAPVRALLQRLGPFEEAAVPVRVARGDRLDQHELVAKLVALGYRREYQVEHRGELAVRGGIVDVYPSTAELPVRIDLWGDEVDRLTEFDPGDQRSVSDLAEIELFGCREVLPTGDVRARAAALVGSEPWGRAQWERLAEGQIFDGMESWLPWLVDTERVLPDLVGAGGRIVLVDPRRIRDRAAELNDEEAALAGALAVTWGVVQSADVGGAPDGSADADPSQRFPRLNVPYERLLQGSAAPVLSMVPVADSPATPAVVARAVEPVHGDRALLAARLSELVAGGYSVTVCAEGAGSASRLAAVLAEEGMVVP